MAYKILSIVGARPNLMKVAALWEAIKDYNSRADSAWIEHVLVHTGQNNDGNMSDLLFNDLELPKPNIFLGVDSGSHSAQTANAMERFETVLLVEKPDVVVVVGHLDSTVACALMTKKISYSPEWAREDLTPTLAHIEAGLRSFDRTMPEELNRIVTDSISDLLFTTEESANENLRSEGIPEHKIYFVGNLMIDTLLRYRSKANESSILNDLRLCENGAVRPYTILTLHRPVNVDNAPRLARITQSFLDLSRHMPIIFPAHPGTLKQIQQAGLGDYFVDHFLDGPARWDSRVRIRLLPSLGYLDFLQLMSHAKVVVTDSGGIQEETTLLGIPCITMSETTERPITISHGTNMLVGADPKRLTRAFSHVLHSVPQPALQPAFWDGNAASRIVDILVETKGTRSDSRFIQP